MGMAERGDPMGPGIKTAPVPEPATHLVRSPLARGEGPQAFAGRTSQHLGTPHRTHSGVHVCTRVWTTITSSASLLTESERAHSHDTSGSFHSFSIARRGLGLVDVMLRGPWSFLNASHADGDDARNHVHMISLWNAF